ncbi:hypothetical protein BCR42DRAFT_452576 [Absidia repens]|uniref:Uncharacterized protein n=1 Tax=Absidia repens TaxID=90262 RepID=A0A1X2ICN2_9FUNG|nr:hypothetical protein BCR42DRAFT_452576 [Absidia repens]
MGSTKKTTFIKADRNWWNSTWQSRFGIGGTTTELVRHANWKPLLLSKITVLISQKTNWTLVGPSAFLPAICYWTLFILDGSKWWKPIRINSISLVVKFYH